MTDIVEVQHLPVEKGRAVLRTTDWHGSAIPSISPVLTTRWQAAYKEKFLDPGENEKFLQAVLDHMSTLTGVTTQRDIYYAIRGAHPDWEYKGIPLGAEFYEHMVMWIMEKLQLKTGMTMQSMGVVAGFRGYITGDGTIRTPSRGTIPLSGKPALAFDLADVGAVLSTHARKVIHFEKDAGLEALTSNNFPRYVEAVFSTSQGQLSEAANKFLRECENRGMDLFSVHDGDPSGIQMQLLYGMASKNNCYMPSDFYPTLVQPLGFYPSIGRALGLPPEDVTDKEDRIFDNLLDLLEGKQRTFPQLRRFGLANEVDVIVTERKKWEFQALNAIHEQAPKVYLLEGLRVHNNEVKHVPEASSIKAAVVQAARNASITQADQAVEKLARQLLEGAVQPLVQALRGALSAELGQYNFEVTAALEELNAIPADHYREYVKRQLVAKPEKYAADVIKAMGPGFISASFTPKAAIELNYELSDISSTTSVRAIPPRADLPVSTKTNLVDAIEKEILPNAKTRSRVVSLIRGALEKRFGVPNEQW